MGRLFCCAFSLLYWAGCCEFVHNLPVASPSYSVTQSSSPLFNDREVKVGWGKGALGEKGLMGRRTLLAIGLIAITAVGASVIVLRPQDTLGQETADSQPFVAPIDVDTNSLRGPRQPVFYRHDIHAGQYGMDCRYCHYTAEVSSEPGLPTISTCMGCHTIIGSGNLEVQKLRDASSEGQPIEWIRIHNLPDHVRFPHMLHVNAGVTCQTCHGEVQQMAQVYQFAPLRMGWCLDCHKENDVTTDCLACHY